MRADVSSQQVEALAQSFADIIGEFGGTVAKTEHWGLRTLAYRINKNRKAHYVLFNIDGPPAAVQEMERNMRLNEDVLRTLTLKVDELEEGPSVVLQVKGRDDRGRRDRRPREGGEGGDAGRQARDGGKPGPDVKDASEKTPAPKAPPEGTAEAPPKGTADATSEGTSMADEGAPAEPEEPPEAAADESPPAPADENKPEEKE